MTEHVLEPSRVHYSWSAGHPPALEIDPGDVVHCQTDEVSGGQIRPGSPASSITEIDFERVYPLAGPIYVRGAQPGDTLEIEIVGLKTLGWAGILPGLGLLDQDFTAPYIRHFDLSNERTTALRDDIPIPIQPFLGTMGVATAEAGEQPVMPPTAGGGNIDTRHLGVGARLRLPVFVPGALFSAGDGHAAQGDGEVTVTAIEAPLAFSLRFGVIKETTRPSSYNFRPPPGSLTPQADAAGYQVTSALGPDGQPGTADDAIPPQVYREAVDAARPALQALYRQTFAEADVEALVFPTTPALAQPIQGSTEQVTIAGRKVPTFGTFIHNIDPGSNAGLPGLSLPAGLTADGLPVGLGIDGPAGSDRCLLAIGAALARVLGPVAAPKLP